MKTQSTAFYWRMLSLFCVSILASACATTDKQEAKTVNITAVQEEAYQPITRLAFVEQAGKDQRITLIKGEPRSVSVSEIETAAGSSRDQVIEH